MLWRAKRSAAMGGGVLASGAEAQGGAGERTAMASRGARHLHWMLATNLQQRGRAEAVSKPGHRCGCAAEVGERWTCLVHSRQWGS